MNLLTTALATLLSFLFTGLAMVYARRSGLIDVPGERHSHNQATPRGGGAGLVLAFVLGACGGDAFPFSAGDPARGPVGAGTVFLVAAGFSLAALTVWRGRGQPAHDPNQLPPAQLPLLGTR